MGKKKERENPSQGKKQKIRRGYRGAQSHVSVYFLVWTIFATFTLLIVLMFGFTQRFIMTQSYKNEASKEVSVKGEQIADDIEKGIPPIFNGNVSAFLRILSQQHGVQVYLFSQEGNLLFPTEPSLEDFEDGEVYEEVKREAALLVKKMQQAKGESVLYEGDGAYVYGKEVRLYSESTMYLYVGQSLSLIETVSAEMTVRTILIAIFTFILGFAIASAVAGWLTKPLSEMTEKAHRLAQGDFSVDFRGNEYGLELIELADTLNFARDELSKTDRMQKELIANVSHDFKTPLTMIKAYASMIMEISGSNPVKRNKHAQVIVDEADRLSSLVSDVLDLSKIRAGLSEFNTKTIDMSMKVEEILDRFAYLKETQGYRFVADIEKDLYTAADEVKIDQALYNLIGNAINYTGEDKLVYVQLKKSSEETFRFAVTDTGKGIKQEELAEIWDRYYRSSEAHKRPVQGTGLGLSIVKTVLEIHRFEFGVESEVGKGSTFYVEFPCVEEKE